MSDTLHSTQESHESLSSRSSDRFDSPTMANRGAHLESRETTGEAEPELLGGHHDLWGDMRRVGKIYDRRPGSGEAVSAGCTCAVIDNHHGEGRYGDGSKYGWFLTGDCPLHGFDATRRSIRRAMKSDEEGLG